MPDGKSAVPTKRWIIVLTAMALAVGIIGLLLFKEQRAQQQLEVAAHLRAIADLKVSQISAWRTEREADALVLMEDEYLIESIESFITGDSPGEAAGILRQLKSMKERNGYADILLADPNTQERLNLLKDKKIEHKGYSAAVETALADRIPVWTPIHKSAAYPAPHLAIAAPLFSHTSGDPLGALVLICDAARFLYPLLKSWPSQSQTAETLLVQKEGENVLYLNDLRNKADTALNFRLPLNRTDLLAVMAAAGQTGFVTGKDYRGARVAAVIATIPGTPWHLVAKLDMDEAYSKWQTLSLMMMLLIITAVLLVIVFGLVIRQRALKSHYRDLYHSEAALTKAMQRHSITLQAIGDAVIATDAEGRVELMNPAAERLTGWQQNRAMGKKISEIVKIVDEHKRQVVANPLAQVLKTGNASNLPGSALLVSENGNEIPVAISGTPIRSGGDDIIGAVLVFKDRTREHAYEKQIIESERKYRLLSDNSIDVIWMMNMDLEFTYINPAIYAISGFTPEEFIGSRLQDHCDADNFARMAEVIAEEMARGPNAKGVIFEAVILNKEGKPFPVEIRGNINYDKEGNPVSLQGATRDITDRKEAEERLHQAQKMESVGRLAGGVAHDYNNILSVIIGYTELSLDLAAHDSVLYENLEEVYNAAMRSRAITRQLLAFARKDAIIPEVLDLNATVESVLKMIRRLIGEDIELTWLPEKDLWPVKMDPSQIDQILANLCVNARDAIDSIGSIIIETANRPLDADDTLGHTDTAPGDYVCLSISDDGCGMEKETVKNIFEPFFTTKGVGKGTGLGLATVYGIARQNRGVINVYSEPGKGTTFKIYFPRHIGKQEVSPGIKPARSPKGRGEEVLVVEDEPAILKLTTKMLERMGYTVLAANSPAEALALVKKHPREIALLITDVVMPEMNGRQLVETLAPTCPKLKHLFMSGYTAEVIAKSGVVESGVNFIQKPFSAKDLAEKINTVLYE